MNNKYEHYGIERVCIAYKDNQYFGAYHNVFRKKELTTVGNLVEIKIGELI